MAQEIKIEIEPESYAEVYSKLLALQEMAEKINSVMQSAQQSFAADGLTPLQKSEVSQIVEKAFRNAFNEFARR